MWLQINYSPWIVMYVTCLDTTYRKLDDESYKWTQISFDMLILIEKSRSIFTHVNVSVGCHNNGVFVLYVVNFEIVMTNFYIVMYTRHQFSSYESLFKRIKDTNSKWTLCTFTYTFCKYKTLDV